MPVRRDDEQAESSPAGRGHHLRPLGAGRAPDRRHADVPLRRLPAFRPAGPVRAERRGIVRREKNVGATVRFYSAEEVRQIYEVREMLTRQAALMIPLPAPQGLIDD